MGLDFGCIETDAQRTGRGRKVGWEVRQGPLGCMGRRTAGPKCAHSFTMLISVKPIIYLIRFFKLSIYKNIHFWRKFY